MKFHHLARHNQFVASHQQRDFSPTKQQQATNLQHQKQQQQQPQQTNGSLTDDEEDEFNDTQAFYESIDQRQQQQQQQRHLNGQQAANNQLLDTNGFLMDKNKKLFPQKLWELIHNPSIQHCLRWSQDGQRVYLNRNEFEAYYLKTPNNQFHTQKAISFVRQMNMYGFRKVDDCYYENDNFRRDRQHLLRNMIRRHPNKGLFVGLDHHQLAAAAAAQQALQVNQQLQQLEHQHKHRTEQALRINSYLNNHHRFHQSALAAGHHHHPLGHHHSHSSDFEHMSSQLAQAAANHLSQQHQQQQQQHQQQQAPQQIGNNMTVSNGNVGASNGIGASSPGAVHLQPKKSRLLSNFYASALNAGNNLVTTASNRNNGYCSNDKNANNPLQMHNQDSMHSTSSVDTQPSQCSSVVNSGSAGSPRPSSPTALHQRLAAINNRHHHQSSSSSSAAAIRAAVLAARQDPSSIQSVVNKFAASNHNNSNSNSNNGNGNAVANQQAATDLSKQSLATRQALHQTLVRSLLQLKQQSQHPQDLLASLQQQNPRTLLESLASLSSVGTGSIVDPTSTPTERTATPPSSPPSPGVASGREQGDYNGITSVDYMDNNNMALDLAKSSAVANFDSLAKRQLASIVRRQHDGDDEDDADGATDYVINRAVEEEEEEETEVEEDSVDGVVDGNVASIKSPLDGARKVRRFLDNQMAQKQATIEDESPTRLIKRELSSPDTHLDASLPQKKRIKLNNNINNYNNNNTISADKLNIDSILKSLVLEISERRGERLDVTALQEAARYTECFLDILLEDAGLIASHSSTDDDIDKQEADGDQDADINQDVANSEEADGQDVASPDHGDGARCKKRKKLDGTIVDSSSLSLALKLIPSKLLTAIQQQVSIKSQS